MGNGKLLIRKVQNGYSLLVESGMLIFIGGILGFLGMNFISDVYLRFVSLTILVTIVTYILVPFFTVAGKEIYEKVFMSNGSMRGSKAGVVIFGTIGGVIFPILVFLVLREITNAEVARTALVIVTATDIALAMGIAKIRRFPEPAKDFLLLLSVVDDLIAVMIILIFFPHGERDPAGFAAIVGVLLIAYCMNRLPQRVRIGAFKTLPQVSKGTTTKSRLRWYWYKMEYTYSYVLHLIPRNIMWRPVTHYGWYLLLIVAMMGAFYLAGIEVTPAGMLIIPFIPHADRDFGLYKEIEMEGLTDTLNQLEHALVRWVPLTLFVFAFFKMGVAVSTFGMGTFLILAGLAIGKPLGIISCSKLALRLGFLMPDGMSMLSLYRVGFAASCGFTMSIFMADLVTHGDAASFGEFSMGAALTLPIVIVGDIALVHVYRYIERRRTPEPVEASSDQLTYKNYAD